MVELGQVKRFRLETLPGHEVVSGTSRRIHKKHTRSKRGRHGVNTYRSFLRVSFWHLFKIYLRLIFPLAFFLQSVATLFVAKLTKLFLHPQEMNTTIVC